MTSYRFFMFVTCIACTGTSLFAQTKIEDHDIWIRERGNIMVRVSVPLAQGGCRTKYSDNDDCPAHHQTPKGNSFEHIHVHYSFPVSGTVVRNDDPNVTVDSQKEITATNVRAYWDWWYAIEAKERERSYPAENEDATRNCWGYAFEYGCWVLNADRIYNDHGYVPTDNPVTGDVIRQNQNKHVIVITFINRNETPHLVVGTREKNQYSGIYYFLYEYSHGLGGRYKNYYRLKP